MPTLIHVIVHDNPAVACSDFSLDGESAPIRVSYIAQTEWGAENARIRLKRLKEAGRLRSFELFLISPGADWSALADDLLSADKESSLAYFQSSSVHPESGILARMQSFLEKNPCCAGVNPLLTEGWHQDSARAAFLGIVCDFKQYLHFLYKGIPLSHPLASKRRYFQLAHPGACLLRLEDFRKAGGFGKAGALAWYFLCLKLLRIRESGFTVDSSCASVQTDRLESWRLCGFWNSTMQRGRLHVPELKPDYYDIASSDGLSYELDPWLNEYAYPPAFSHVSESVKDIDWHLRPSPASLVSYTAQLPLHEARIANRLASTLPSSLPRTFHFYEVECNRIRESADMTCAGDLAVKCGEWQRRARRFHYALLRPGIELLKNASFYDLSLDRSPSVFDAWVEVKEKCERITPGYTWPAISVLMPVWNPDPLFLKEALDSVLGQSYANWELCIADDCSTDYRITELLRSYEAREGRIKVIFREQNGHICAATNSALGLAISPYTAFLDHDDMLAKDALALVARKFASDDRLRFIYSDEDHIDTKNIRRSPVFRAEFDPELFFIGHISAYSTDLIRKAGCLREGLEGSQDFDLRLRISSGLRECNIAHIPRILYHWRVHEHSTSAALGAKPYILEATKQAMRDYYGHKRIKGEVRNTGKNNYFIYARELAHQISCGVVFLGDERAPEPTPELTAFISEAARNLPIRLYYLPVGSKKGYDTGSASESHIEGTGIGACWPELFNQAANLIKEDVILFLYNGLKPEKGCFLPGLLAEAARPEITMAGGLLWHRGHLQNGGLYPDITGLPFPLLKGVSRDDLGTCAWGQFLLPRRTIGVSWKCVAMNKESLKQEPFLDNNMGEYALTDFALRQLKRGMAVLCTPWGQWEDSEKEREPDSEMKEKFKERWGEIVRKNGLRNPNLKAAQDNGWTLIL